MAIVARKHKWQATLPGAGPAPEPWYQMLPAAGSKSITGTAVVYKEPTECPPGPPVLPFSQELQRSWITPEKDSVSPRMIVLGPKARASLYEVALAALEEQCPSSSRAELLRPLREEPVSSYF